jgi:23S rRNA pseudouridine1911/1915/1917 synthase
VNEPSSQISTFIFDDDQSQRLDKFLVACFPDLSRSRIQRLIKDGHVTVNGELPHKSGQLLESRAFVHVIIPPIQPTLLEPEPIPLDVIFESEDLIVVNKPAGMVVHPAAGHTSGTLVHAVLAHAPEMQGIGGEQRPGVVHRLDRDTSGLILLAKNDRMHRYLQEGFRLRKIQKVYLALVDGQPPTPEGRIDVSVGRDLRNRKKMAVVPPEKGRPAISEYHTLENFPDHTLLEIHPITGRTHQIRLHLAFLGCPVAGDAVYGRRHPTLPLNRQFLHAERLILTLPGDTHSREFYAPLPPELQTVLESLRRTKK